MSTPWRRNVAFPAGIALAVGLALGWYGQSRGTLATAPPVPVAEEEVPELLERVWLRLNSPTPALDTADMPDPEGEGLAAFVTVRRPDGRLVTCMWALDPDLERATLRATDRVLGAARFQALDRETLARCTLELNFTGPLEPLPDASLESFRRHVELGRHGIVCWRDGRATVYKETVAVTHNWDHAKLRERLAAKAGLEPGRAEECELFRFTGSHWIRYPDGRVRELAGAHPRIALEEVTPRLLEERARLATEWLLRQQTAEGNFRYCYHPSRDEYEPGDNLVRQAGTLMALAQAADRFRDPELFRALDAGIGYFRGTLAERDGLTYVSTPGGGALGATALFLLALLASPALEEHEDLARQLAGSLVARQTADGKIFSFFEHDDCSVGQSYYPPETLFAIARAYERFEDPRYLELVRRGIDFYYLRWQEDSSGGLTPWLVQAISAIEKLRPDPRWREMIYTMTDRVWVTQIAESGEVYLDGAQGPGGDKGPSFATATMSEALASAIATADRAGDDERAERYRGVLRRALRFVAQLQITEEGTFYMARPELAVGGVRQAVADNRLRIDQAQHAIIAWLEGSRRLADGSMTTHPRNDGRANAG